MIESFNQQGILTHNQDGLDLELICDPRAVLSQRDLQSIATSCLGIARVTSGRVALEMRDIAPFLFGSVGRGKMLLIISQTDEIQRIIGFVSGQILNNGTNPIRINDQSIFHISSAHISPKSGKKTLKKSLQFLYSTFDPKIRPSYFSAYTQNPRIYAYLERELGDRLYPHYLVDQSSCQLARDYSTLVRVLSEGRRVENGVFRNKITGSFHGRSTHTSNRRIDEWFYNTLKVDPDNGDLLLMCGLIP